MTKKEQQILLRGFRAQERAILKLAGELAALRRENTALRKRVLAVEKFSRN